MDAFAGAVQGREERRMRLIDADKLIDDLSDLKKSPWANEPWLSDQRKLGMREAIDMIQSIVRVDSQTVDAEPVIRCKDCKFHHDRTQCSKRIGAWFDDDYCNGAVNAERKEE